MSRLALRRPFSQMNEIRNKAQARAFGSRPCEARVFPASTHADLRSGAGTCRKCCSPASRQGASDRPLERRGFPPSRPRHGRRGGRPLAVQYRPCRGPRADRGRDDARRDGSEAVRGAARRRPGRPGLELIDTGLSIDGVADTGPPCARREAGFRTSRRARRRHRPARHPGFGGRDAFGSRSSPSTDSCIAAWWEAVHESALPAELAWRTELVRAGLQAADAVVVPTASFGAAVGRFHRLAKPPRTVHYGRPPFALPIYAPHDFVFTAGRLWDEGKNLGLLDEAAGRIPVPVRAAGPIHGPNGAAIVFDNIDCVGNLRADELASGCRRRPRLVSRRSRAVGVRARGGLGRMSSSCPTFRLPRALGGHRRSSCPRATGTASPAPSPARRGRFRARVMSRASSERAKLYSRDAMAAQMRGDLPQLLHALQRRSWPRARAAA